MAIYYLSVKPIGRGTGKSAVGASAYRSGEKLHNEYDGITHDYTNRRSAVGSAAYRSGDKLQDDNQTHDFTKKQNIIHSEIMLPDYAPKEYADRSTLWNSVELSEKQSNARTAREVVVALPNELNTEQNIELVRDYVQRNFVSVGMCADVCIHSGHIQERKGKKYPFEGLTVQQENPHAHIMLTVRPINADGSWGAKSKKEYILDKDGNKIKLPSGNWRSRKIDSTDWDKTATLEKWREDWARTTNRAYERLGIDERINHKSLKSQGLDREPMIHMGVKSWNMEKKGIRTERGDRNREIIARNKRKQQPEKIAEYMHELKKTHFALDKEINELQEISNETKRDMNISLIKAEEITEHANDIKITEERLDELKTERRSIGIFKNKKDIDRKIQHLEHSHKQATSYFERTYKIAPEQAGAEVKRLEMKVKSKERFHIDIQDKLKPLEQEQSKNIIEYQRQKMLVEIRPDREKIHNRLSELEKESRQHMKSVKDNIAWLRCGRMLDKETEKLIKQRDRERVREYERIRCR